VPMLYPHDCLRGVGGAELPSPPGKRMGRVGRDEHRFVYDHALPGAQYRYEVEAVCPRR
jgi:hypothetical protein